MKIVYILKEMRVHHYIKNFLVMLPLVCSGQLFTSYKLTEVFLGFFAFSFLSSCIYIINDIRDVEKDKVHPIKCKRPIAAGKISVKEATVLSVFLFITSVLCNTLTFNIFSSILLVIYLILNIAYSFGLKNVPLLDIVILVSGFLIRTLYGAIITDIKISNWLYLVVVTAAFYLALGKRRNELKMMGDECESRSVIKKYSYNFLNQNMYMCIGLLNVSYALWTMDDATIQVYGSYLIWTVPLVLLICMKYSMTIESDSDGDPVEVLLHDIGLIVMCVIYVLVMLFLLYLR